MKYRMGVDLGTASVAIAAFELDGDGEARRLAHIDLCIFAEPAEKGTTGAAKLKNAVRREKRLARRQLARTKGRMKKIVLIAESLGINREDLSKVQSEGVHELRAKAVEEKIELAELFKVFLLMAKNRGYAGNLNKEGKVKKSIDGLQAHLDGKTLGQYQLELKRKAALDRSAWKIITKSGNLEGTFISRGKIEEEFEKILEEQVKHHDLLKEDYKGLARHFIGIDEGPIPLQDALRSAILGQRPLKWNRDSVGNCPLEPGEKRASKAQPVFQEFRIEKTLQDLRWSTGKRGREGDPLTDEQKSLLRSLFYKQKQVPFKTMYRELGVSDARFTADRSHVTGREDDGRKGNTTWAVFRALKGDYLDRFLDLSDMVQESVIEFMANSGTSDAAFANDLEKAFIEQSIAYQGLGTDDKTKVINFLVALRTHKDFSDFRDMKFDTGRADYSVKAMRKLIPFLHEGKNEYEAREAAYPGLSTSRGKQSNGMLRPIEDLVAEKSINSPVVTKSLREFKRLYDYAVHRLGGQPESVVIELSRDLKNSLQQRYEIEMIINQNEKRRTAASEELSRVGVPPTDKNIKRYLLWNEQGHKCAYTLAEIGLESLIHCEIDHIIPQALGGTSSWYNLVLVTQKANREKGNQTPWQVFKDTDCWSNTEKMSQLLKEGGAAREEKKNEWLGKTLKRKAALLVSKQTPDERDPEALNRQNQETAWIGRVVAEWLGDVLDPIQIQVSRGKITARLRRIWGLDNILPSVRLAEGKPLLTKERKEISPKAWEDHDKRRQPQYQFDKRCDHRHHIIDATITALVSRSIMKSASDYHAKNGDLNEGVHPQDVVHPDTGEILHKPEYSGYYTPLTVRKLHAELKRRLTGYCVWHKPDRNPGMDFFQDSVYGLKPDPYDSDHTLLTRRYTLKEVVKSAGIDPEKYITTIEKRVVGNAIKTAIIAQFKARVAKGMNPMDALCGKENDPSDGIWHEGNKIKKVKAYYATGGLVSFDDSIDYKHNDGKSGQLSAGYACICIDSTTNAKKPTWEPVPLWRYHSERGDKGIKGRKEATGPTKTYVFPNDIVYLESDNNFYVVCSISEEKGLLLKKVTEAGSFNEVHKCQRKKLKVFNGITLISSREVLKRVLMESKGKG